MSACSDSSLSLNVYNIARYFYPRL